jgi:hypothetical protein
MPKTPEARKGNVLKKYEVTNLLFFLIFIGALAVFVAVVFKSYGDSDKKPARSEKDNGIVSEVVSPTADLCLFYLGTQVSTSNRRYSTILEIPATDDGLVRGLFALSGVTEVLVNQKLIVLQKSPSARWETIRPGAREVISQHIHMHQ